MDRMGAGGLWNSMVAGTECSGVKAIDAGEADADGMRTEGERVSCSGMVSLPHSHPEAANITYDQPPVQAQLASDQWSFLLFFQK